MHTDAPPNNNSSAISELTFNLTAGNQVNTETLTVNVYRLAQGQDVWIAGAEYTILSGAAVNDFFSCAIPYTDKYRAVVTYSGVAASATYVTVTVSQTWNCGTLRHNALPQISSIQTNLQRVRIMGSAVDIINQTPDQFRGGSVVGCQLPAGTSEYQVLQQSGGASPYSYVANIRGVETRDMKDGMYAYLKPDGETAFKWQTPFSFDPTGALIQYAKMPAIQQSGFVMVAMSAPDLVTAASTTTTRGQVTLDARFSVEIDSQFNWFDFDESRASPDEWDRAEEILAVVEQFWEDPNWAKIWAVIKGGARIGANILSAIPHPTAQAIGRGTNAVVNVLDSA
jgi:hypothetical protein